MRFGEFWKLHGRNTGRAPIPKASSSGRSASRLLAGSSMNCTYLLWPWPTPAFRPYHLPAPDSGGCSRAQQERRLGGPPGPLGADTRIKARTVPALWLSPRQERARSREQKKTITAQAAWERTDAQAAAPAGPRSAHAQKAGARGRTPSLPPPSPRRRPYLHGDAEVHHGDAGVAVPAHVHHGVAAVRGLALQRGARGAEVVLRLLVARRLLRGLCGGSKRRRFPLCSPGGPLSRPLPGAEWDGKAGSPGHPPSRKSHWQRGLGQGRLPSPSAREPPTVFSPPLASQRLTSGSAGPEKMRFLRSPILF